MKGVALLCLLASLIQRISPQGKTTEDYDGYLRAVEIFRQSFDFSTEEAWFKPQPILKMEFSWDRTPWVMGVKGRDQWGKWITTAECLSVMVRPTVGLLPCACVWSWYLSFRSRHKKFSPAPDRTEFDITGPEIFLYHTVHPEEDSKLDYFQGEVTRYYTVLNDPMDSQECDAAYDINAGRPGAPIDPAKREAQIDGLTLVEVDNPVIYDGTIPVQMPMNYVHDDFTELNRDWPLNILFYGAQFVNPDQIFVPKFAESDYEKKHERWRTWNNNWNLKYELISLAVQPANRLVGCRDKFFWRGKSPLECWESADEVPQLCNIVPGATIITRTGDFYGIVVNSNPCPSTPADMTNKWFEVRRINDDFDIIAKLLPEWVRRENDRKAAAVIANKAQRLFNLSIGSINYDEDVDPRLRSKLLTVVQKKQPFGRSTASTFTCFALTMLIPSLWYHYTTTNR